MVTGINVYLIQDIMTVSDKALNVKYVMWYGGRWWTFIQTIKL